ncbi:aspartate ammonia-lyase [Priestia megaterium]|jgi:aspartate ammonia-lyase|nr:aspartate ammonia-lyase [Priestia megaterium]
MLNLNEEKKVEIRIEKDFLGIKEVPRSAYYGIQTLRAVKISQLQVIPLIKNLLKHLEW